MFVIMFSVSKDLQFLSLSGCCWIFVYWWNQAQPAQITAQTGIQFHLWGPKIATVDMWSRTCSKNSWAEDQKE